MLQQVAEDPLLVDLPAVAWLQPQAFGNSLPSVVEWLSVSPHDLLLVSHYLNTRCVLFHKRKGYRYLLNL